MDNGHIAAPDFWIDQIPIYGNLILAPMDGYSDHPFRLLTRKFGSSICYSEFINALDYLQGHPYLEEKLYFTQQERPFAYQILDNDPDRIVYVASALSTRGADFIDINLGCPNRSVVNRGAGAALLNHPETIQKIFQSLSKNLHIPVTAKIRLGWDDNTINYRTIAQIIADTGGKCLAVHARSRKQGHTGRADWDAIATIKQQVHIPVIGNGGISSPEEAKRMIAYTKCDGVMIGRAAIGYPWIFNNIPRNQVTIKMVHKTMLEHLTAMCNYYPESRGCTLFRKHTKKYLAPYLPADEKLDELLSTENKSQFIDQLNQIIMQIQDRNLQWCSNN